MTMTCFYDDLSRLTGIAESPGDTAIYRYDIAGNLVGIVRQSSSVVAVIEFTPKSAPVGTSITIGGTGFSQIPDENTVQFGGTSGAVVSASATQIVAIVPPGAATGSLTVVSPAGSADTSAAFEVIAESGAPTISQFVPAMGSPGTAVTITGMNLESGGMASLATINHVFATLTSISATRIEVEVPPGAGSGRISISTPFGQAVNDEDFFVPPPPRTPAEVAFTGRLALDGSVVVTTSEAGIALVVFDGGVGRPVNLGISGVRHAGGGLGVIEVSILDPHGTALVSKLVGELGEDIDTEVLLDVGSYTIMVDPLEGDLERVTLTLSEPLTRTLSIDGPPVTIALRPGQDARLTFEGTADQRISLGIGDASFGPEGPSALGGDVSILQPDGTSLASRPLGRNAMSITTGNLPETGEYAVHVDPREAELRSLSLTLSETFTEALRIDGPAVTVTLRPGQAARLTFEGTTGTRVNLGITDVRFQHDIAGGMVSVLRPDGTTVSSTNLRKIGSDIDTGPLPEAGEYVVLVDPAEGSVENLTLTLTAPTTGTLAVNGPSITLALRPGQDARLTFEGIAGQRVRLGISDVTFEIGGAIAGGDVSVLHPDGTTVASTVLSTQDTDVDITSLPDTAAYGIVVNPPGVLSVTLTLILARV